MTKGRATAAYTVGYDVTDGELHITINVPSTHEDTNYNLDTLNGSVALGAFVQKLGVKYASVPTKARQEQEDKAAQLAAAGKTDYEADTIMVMFYPEWVR